MSDEFVLHKQGRRSTRFALGPALLSLTVSGMGQAYQGRVWRGAALLLLAYALSWGLLQMLPQLPPAKGSLVLLALGALVFHLAVAWDAGWLAPADWGAKKKRHWLWVGAIFAASIGLHLCLQQLLARNFSAGRTYYIPSESMVPTLLIGDYIAADLRAFEAARGDVVVYRRNGRSMVKRVAAVAGDRVAVEDGVLVINNVPLPAAQKMELQFAPVVVPAGAVFLLGDNINNSHDSRHHGPIPVSDVVGRATWIFWSANWHRVGKSLTHR